MADRSAGGRELEPDRRDLEARLAAAERANVLLRAREQAYRALLDRASSDSFVFEVAFRESRNGEPPVLDVDPTTISFILPERLQEKAALAVSRGQPVWYKETRGSGSSAKAWRIHLIPVRDAEGALIAVAGRASLASGTRSAARRSRKSDRVVKNLVELLPDAVIVTNVAGQIVHINSAGLAMLGASTREEVMGRMIWDMLHPDDRERSRSRARQVQKGGHVGLEESRLVRLDGAIVPIETLSVVVRYSGRAAILSTARDISSRKQLEEELSESRELFYKAFKSSPVGYVITRLSDGVVVDANEEFAQSTGYTRDELVGRSTVDLQLFDAEARDETMRDVEAHGAVHQRMYSVRRKDRALRRFLTSVQRVEIGDEVCLISVAVDETEREQAAQAERESRDLLYRVFHASPAAIAIVRRSDGRYIDVNEQWCRLTGYEADEVVGKTRADVGLWPDAADRERVEASGNVAGAVHDLEVSLDTKGDGRKTVLVSTQDLQVRGEAAQLIVLVDITERKRVEVELLRQKERAEEMSQIKTAFLTNMTHEVRTPLTVILGFTSMLRQGSRPEYQRFVRVIERSGRRLLLMLDSILDLAQLEAGTLSVEKQVFNLSDVVTSEAEVFRPIAEEKGLSVTVALPEQRAHALADHKIFVRVLNNLFDNAVKFTERGGVTLRVGADGDRVHVVVEDTGLGIEEAFIPRVFDEFAQESTGLERTHQGSGLGLTVSRRLVELMDGSIEVVSAKGEGSRFTVYLPASSRRRG